MPIAENTLYMVLYRNPNSWHIAAVVPNREQALEVKMSLSDKAETIVVRVMEVLE